MKTAAYVGSFDPFTNGHLSVVEQAIGIFDNLFIAIGTNPKKTPTFTLEERMALIKESTAHLDGGNVIVDAFPDRTQVDYADSVGARYIVRGIRNQEDWKFERKIHTVNAKARPEIMMVYFMPLNGLYRVSSSMVKNKVGPEGWEQIVRKYVPTPVFEKLRRWNDERRV